MSTLRDLIESFVFSLGDPRKPAEIILRKVGREIFPPKEADDIYIDALYQAIKDETGAAKLVFSKEELRKWLNVDLGEIDIAPEGEFFKKISKALKDNIPLIPERALTDEDYEQIARNAVRRARGVFFDALSSEKNSAVFNKIVLQESARLGVKVEDVLEEVQQGFPELGNRLDEIREGQAKMEKRLAEILAEVQKMKNSATVFLELARQAESDVSVAQRIQAVLSDLELRSTVRETESLIRQVDVLERRLGILEEQKLRFGPSHTPPHILLDFEDDVRTLQEKKARLDDVLRKLSALPTTSDV